MDQTHYKEMVKNLDLLIGERVLEGKRLYLFGHCSATEKLADLLLENGFLVAAILDNNTAKQGRRYRDIEICPPRTILEEPPGTTLVCIAARACAAMTAQLRRLGYKGPIRKLVEYNSFAEYSLAPETVEKGLRRMEQGKEVLAALERKYPGYFLVLCPFSALGDVYLTMAYLPRFLKKRGICHCVVGVVGKACGEVVRLFDNYTPEVLSQQDMDEAIQAALYTENKHTFIAHQDRPYVVDLSKALYVKKIPLDVLYCCGVFGLPLKTKPCKPTALRRYEKLEEIEEGRAVVLSPYAKSVTALDPALWMRIVEQCRQGGYSCYTNVVGEEAPLPGTAPISPSIGEVRSVVEKAGTFIGIRSGLCDVLREARCRKIALYPDYHYCDTQWKAIEIYALPGWENLAAEELLWDKN